MNQNKAQAADRHSDDFQCCKYNIDGYNINKKKSFTPGLKRRIVWKNIINVLWGL